VAAVYSVLLVAPDGQFRDDLHRTLRSKGYLVFVAGRAHSALDVLSGLQFDLVACWPVLPDGSGAELLAEVQRRCTTSTLLLLGTDPASADLDLELLLRVSRVARRDGTRRNRAGGS
jgi:DNA-binding response OmpR family regulator